MTQAKMNQGRDARKPAWSLRDALDIAFRHKKTIAAFFSVVMVSTIVVTFVISPVYESEVKFLIRLGRENLAIDPSVSGPTASLNRDRESEVNSEVSIFTSRELAENVVDTLGEEAFIGPEHPEYSAGLKGYAKRMVDEAKGAAMTALTTMGLHTALPRREAAIGVVQKSLNVAAERRTNIISARFEASSPQLAHDTLELLMKAYFDRHIQVYSAQAKPAFFQDKAAQLREELVERERILADYQAKNGITSLPQQKEAMIQQVSGLEKELSETTATISGSKARMAALEKALSSAPKVRELSRTTGRTNTAADSLKTRLFELRVKETDLSTRYADSYQPLIDLREQIKELETDLAKEEDTRTEVTTGVDTNRQELELSLSTEEASMKESEAREEVLNAEIARQREALASLAELETELNGLTRDVDVAQAAYRQFMDNLQRAEASVALDLDKVSNVSVVQAATVTSDPVRPKRVINLAFGFVLAGIGSAGLVLLLELLDGVLRTKVDGERRLDVPVLIEISEREFEAVV